MLDDLWQNFVVLSKNEYLRYMLSVAIGFAGAYGVQWLHDWRYERRTREAVREALAEEIASNLVVLDHYEKSFKQGLSDPAVPPTVRWPTGTLNFATLTQCLNPAIGALLGAGEQAKVSLVYYQVTELENDMKEAREDIWDRRSNPMAEYDKLLSRHIPPVAQNQLDFLCQLMDHQTTYASSRLIEIAEKMLPAISYVGSGPPRLWRTSDLPRSNPLKTGETMLIAWRNDDPDAVPQDIKVIEIRPTQKTRFTLDPNRREHSKIRRKIQAFFKKRSVQRASRRIQQERTNRG